MLKSVPQNVYVEAGDIVLFYDSRYPPDPIAGPEDPTVNRMAVIVNERGALSLVKGRFGRHVETIPLQQIPGLANLLMRRSSAHAEYNELVADYFLQHVNNPSLFQAGLAAYYNTNSNFFETGGVFPIEPRYTSDEDFDKAWTRFKAALQPLDLILTFDRSSRLSQFIAWATGGPWSHVAMYVANGDLSEHLTTGYRRGPIELYKEKQQYRIAAYRALSRMENPATPQEGEELAATMASRPRGYNYRAAIKFGWKSFCGDHDHNAIPNAPLYCGQMVLIEQV